MSSNILDLFIAIWHWCENDQIKHVLLSPSEVDRSHTGELLAASLSNTCEEYNIFQRTGYYMIDNATNNDTCLEHFYRQRISLSNTSTTKEPTNTEVKKHVNKYRLRCFSHIINLTAKVLLFGDTANVFELEDVQLETSENAKDYLLQIENW